MAMSLICIIIGVVSLIVGVIKKWRQETDILSENALKRYVESFDTQRDDFVEQFKLSQERLEMLYAPTLNEIVNRLDEMSHQLYQVVQAQAEQNQSEQWSALGLTESTQTILRQVQQLQQQGKSIEEIAKLLGREVGEVLLFINLSRKSN